MCHPDKIHNPSKTPNTPRNAPQMLLQTRNTEKIRKIYEIGSYFFCIFRFGGGFPKGPSRTVFSTESDSVVFYYSVVNLLHIVIHYSKYSKSAQSVMIHYIFSSESLRVVNSLQIANSLCVLFLVCRGPLGWYFAVYFGVRRGFVFCMGDVS